MTTQTLTDSQIAALAAGTVVLPSRSGGAGHTVVVKTARDGSRYLTCGCPGGRFAFASKTHPGRGCWAMQTVRRVVEAATPAFFAPVK